MITQEELQELIGFDGGESQVVSVYLNTDAGEQSSETIKLQARSLLKEAAGNFHKDVEKIEAYLDLSFDWTKPGLALFSCADKGFFRSFPTAVSYRNRVRISPKPHVKPLAHLVEYYANYGVIVVDRIGARFFEYHLAELQDKDGIMGEDIHKSKQGADSGRGGGSASATGSRGGQDRHEEEAIQRNLRETAEAAGRFFAGKSIRRLFIGGTAENVAQFREHLTKQLQSRIAGTFAIDMTAGEHEVRKQSIKLMQEANARREDTLVQNMITSAAKGINATIGLDSTLQAVGEGRVQTLIISDGYRIPGFVHDGSPNLTANEGVGLPYGEGHWLKVNDVIEAAVQRTMEQGGQIEIVSENAQLEEAGQIGALLRY
jgi:peptide subunit release factor 1 (eRF1)